MSGEFITYQTIEGDRWDLIAWNMYGDPFAYEGLLKANVAVAAAPVLAGGINLVIPMLDAPGALQPSGVLW